MATVINIEEAIKKGFVVKMGDDLTVGPAEDKNNPVAKIAPPRKDITREIEEWDGIPPPTADQKIPKVFQSNEDCLFKTEKGKCKQKLVIHRIMNQFYEKDSNGFGGQLQYLEDDVRYYKQCPVHGPSPPGPESWKRSSE